jgi:hypothetical protein
MGKIVLAGQKTRSLAEAAKLVDPSLTVSEITVKYPNNDVEWNTMLAMFTQMQPGSWFGPESTPKGWRVLQLVNKSVAQQSFDQLPEGLRQNIAGSAGDLARDARFRAFTDSLSQAYLPRVNRALVARVAWPARPPLDVGR